MFNVEAHCGSLHQINSKFGAKVVTYKDNERKRYLLLLLFKKN